MDEWHPLDTGYEAQTEMGGQTTLPAEPVFPRYTVQPPDVDTHDDDAHHWKAALKEIIQILLIVVLVRVGMDTFLPRYVVDGASMEPNFHTSERVIVDRVSMLFSGPSRGDVIVLDSPTADELLIKRVIGLPNETVVIRNGRVYIDGQELTENYVNDFCTSLSCDGEWVLGADQYFVLGDNRSHSLDSHSFGPVERSAIVGIARLRYWPLQDVDLLTAPSY